MMINCENRMLSLESRNDFHKKWFLFKIITLRIGKKHVIVLQAKSTSCLSRQFTLNKKKRTFNSAWQLNVQFFSIAQTKRKMLQHVLLWHLSVTYWQSVANLKQIKSAVSRSFYCSSSKGKLFTYELSYIHMHSLLNFALNSYFIQ